MTQSLVATQLGRMEVEDVAPATAEGSRTVLYEGGQGEYVEKKSRFIANIFPAKSEEEALARIGEIRKKYYDARHNCFAYVISDDIAVRAGIGTSAGIDTGDGIGVRGDLGGAVKNVGIDDIVIGKAALTERCSDDGEPSGTAGRPMLDVLTGQGIHDVVAVVTRYFGGTLLGTGGLVRSYSTAVKEALKNCVLMEQRIGFRLRVRTNYNDIGKLQYLMRAQGLAELETVYADEVDTILLVPVWQVERVEKDITEMTSGRAVLERQKVVRYGDVAGEIILQGGISH